MRHSGVLRSKTPAFLLCALTLGLAAGHAAQAQEGPAPTIHPAGKVLPFAHQGPFVRAGDGSILCIDAKNALRSGDEGRTWKPSPLFADPARYSVSNERALLRTREGVIISAWMNSVEKKSPQGWNWGKPGTNWEDFILPTYTARSLDDGKTWETPIRLSRPWCGCIHSMIQMRSGRIVLVGQEIIPEWRHATVTFVSDDLGKSWQRGQMLDYGVGRHDHAGSIEGTIVERGDGSLLLLLRTESGWLWQAESKDGLAWENLKQSNIRSVTCCAQIARLADGRVALLWNHPPRHAPTSAGSREELALAFSGDDGVTWTKPVVVAASYGPRSRVSYPYLFEIHPGELWITSMQGGLRMSIKLDDLAKGEIPRHALDSKAAPLPRGIVMFGDSTTAPRPGAVEKVYAQRVAEALQGVASSLTIHNAGVGGNNTAQALARMDRDVLAHKPKIVVIQFGINDCSIDVWKDPPAHGPRITPSEFEENLRKIIARTREAGAAPILMTANPLRWTPALKKQYGKPPYDITRPDGLEASTLLRYNAITRKLAEELRVPLIDVHKEFLRRDVDKLLPDGIHPNDAGHAIITEQLVPIIRELARSSASSKK